MTGGNKRSANNKYSTSAGGRKFILWKQSSLPAAVHSKCEQGWHLISCSLVVPWHAFLEGNFRYQQLTWRGIKGQLLAHDNTILFIRGTQGVDIFVDSQPVAQGVLFTNFWYLQWNKHCMKLDGFSGNDQLPLFANKSLKVFWWLPLGRLIISLHLFAVDAVLLQCDCGWWQFCTPLDVINQLISVEQRDVVYAAMGACYLVNTNVSTRYNE